MQIIFILYKYFKNAKYMYILYFLHKRAVMYRLGLWYFMPLSTIFQLYIVAVSFIGRGNRSTRRKPPTWCKFLSFSVFVWLFMPCQLRFHLREKFLYGVCLVKIRPEWNKSARSWYPHECWLAVCWKTSTKQKQIWYQSKTQAF